MEVERSSECVLKDLIQEGKVKHFGVSEAGAQKIRRARPARNSLGARVNLYMAAKKWDMVAAVASHLVKVDPQTPGLVDQSRLCA